MLVLGSSVYGIHAARPFESEFWGGGSQSFGAGTGRGIAETLSISELILGIELRVIDNASQFDVDRD